MNVQINNGVCLCQVDQAAHARLEAVLWRDTAFLAGLGVMDYSLLVGVDAQKHRLVIGIIDFIRQVSTCPEDAHGAADIASIGHSLCGYFLFALLVAYSTSHNRHVTAMSC